MKLNINSWHVKLNDEIYGHGYSSRNTNLCPYFWGTILAILSIVPFEIIKSISSVLSSGTKNIILRYNLCFAWAGVGIINYFGDGTLYKYMFLLSLGAFIMIYIIWETSIFKSLFKSNKPKKPEKPIKEHRPSMAIEMLKGWKNKHCPMIQWDTND